MPQLEQIHVIGQSRKRANLVGIEVAAICLGGDAAKLLIGKIDIERAINAGSPLGIWHRAKRADLIERKLGNRLGNEQAATRRKPIHNRPSKGNGLLHDAARVDVTVLGHDHLRSIVCDLYQYTCCALANLPSRLRLQLYRTCLPHISSF